MWWKYEQFLVHLHFCRQGKFCISLRQINVYEQTDILSWFIHKPATFPEKSCQTNLFRTQAENIFLHGSCTSYKGCTGNKYHCHCCSYAREIERTFLCENKRCEILIPCFDEKKLSLSFQGGSLCPAFCDSFIFWTKS